MFGPITPAIFCKQTSAEYEAKEFPLSALNLVKGTSYRKNSDCGAFFSVADPDPVLFNPWIRDLDPG
jgi:hypothetical protein